MSVTVMSHCDFRVTHSVSHSVSHTTPTRPDPTRPINNYPRSGSIHSVAYVTRASRDAWMTGADAPPGWAA